MDFFVASILFQDGATSGAIYTMLALGFVLVFTTTRIIFASYGDLIAYSAFTLHDLQTGRLPGTVMLLVGLAVLAAAVEGISLARQREFRRLPMALLVWILLPGLPVILAFALQGRDLPLLAQLVLTMLLVIPIAPLLHRIVFQPIETSSTLTLLIVALVLHYVISGLGLLFFGPEGIRTEVLFPGQVDVFGWALPTQFLAVLATAIGLSTALALFFNASLLGKALRATAYNRDGARLVGISTRASGTLAFSLAGVIAAAVGILISPTVVIYYDSGLMIGLKGFVSAVLGGFASYPLAVLGSVLIGMIEAFSAFFASSMKEVIVFLAVIPIILLRWLSARHDVEDEEEEIA